MQIRIGQFAGEAPSRKMPHTLPTASLIKAIKDITGWKQDRIAAELQTSQSQVSRWGSGSSANYDDGIRIRRLAERVGALTNERGTKNMATQVAINGAVVPGGAITWEPEGTDLRLAETGFPLPADRFALIVDADATTHRARKGDLLIAGPLSDDLASLIGREVVLQINESEFAFGILAAGRLPSTFSLIGSRGFICEDCTPLRAARYCATIADGEWSDAN